MVNLEEGHCEMETQVLVGKSDGDIDMFIERMGFTISDGDGNEVKLST